MRQKEVSGKPHNNTNKNLTSGKDVVSSHRGERISDSESTLTEEFRHIKRLAIYSSSSMHPEKETGKPNRDMNKVLTSKWDVKSSYQAGEVHKGERISSSDSTLTEEFHHLNNPSMKQKEESGKPHNNTNKNLTPGKDICKSYE